MGQSEKERGLISRQLETIIPRGPLLPVPAEISRKVMGWAQDALRALGGLDPLLKTSPSKPWRLLTGAQIKDALALVQTAQAVGLRVFPAGAMEVSRKQSLIIEKTLRLITLYGGEDQEWAEDIQKGAITGLSGQLLQTVGFLKDYSSPEVAAQIPTAAREKLEELNENDLSRVFTHLLGFCLPKEVLELRLPERDDSHLEKGAQVLQEAIISLAEPNPSIAIGLLEEWYDILDSIDGECSLAVTMAYVKTASTLLVTISRPEYSQHFEKLAEIIKPSAGFDLTPTTTLFIAYVEALDSSLLSQKAINLLKEIGETDLAIIESEIDGSESSPLQKKRGALISLLRLTLFKEGDIKEEIGRLIEKLKEIISEEGRLSGLETPLTAEAIATLVKELIYSKMSPRERGRFEEYA